MPVTHSSFVLSSYFYLAFTFPTYPNITFSNFIIFFSAAWRNFRFSSCGDDPGCCLVSWIFLGWGRKIQRKVWKCCSSAYRGWPEPVFSYCLLITFALCSVLHAEICHCKNLLCWLHYVFFFFRRRNCSVLLILSDLGCPRLINSS